jgi:Tfp pilus assembly protein PilV
MHRLRHGSVSSLRRGVSLIEAMVSMAVMAFGTLAVLGVQTSLRLNADISKQRSEAVRIGQERLEQARGYADLAAYRDAVIATATPESVVGYATANASYLIDVQVVEPAGLHAPRQKTFVTTVNWQDRGNQPQSVRIASVIHGTPPMLRGSLVVPGDTGPIRNPGNRHFSIPRDAVLEVGTDNSRYSPPGAPVGVTWVFNNVSGFITQRCAGALCDTFNGRLLAGFVRFATAVPDPGPADTEVPPGGLMAVGIDVVLTSPAAPAAAVCFVNDELVSGSRVYACAVPVDGAGRWSGRSNVTGLSLAASVADTTAGLFRVCRYTPYREHRLVPSQMRNEEHPLDYVNVANSLPNQNFLVVRASGVNGCPSDGPAPQVNTNTWHHQPSA